MRDYRYDIFLSVKRDDTFGDWLRSHFIPLFFSYLKQDVIVKCHRKFSDYFFYEQTLRPGDPWPDELKDGIRRSRVALALCSPEYFYSDWCLTEFYSFLNRGGKVLVPVSIYDGEAFPKDARNIQSADLSQYVLVGKGFKDTERYIEFQDKLKTLSKDVAERIGAAPDYCDWPIEEKTVAEAEPEIKQKTLES
jgi:TIR domain